MSSRAGKMSKRIKKNQRIGEMVQELGPLFLTPDFELIDPNDEELGKAISKKAEEFSRKGYSPKEVLIAINKGAEFAVFMQSIMRGGK